MGRWRPTLLRPLLHRPPQLRQPEQLRLNPMVPLLSNPAYCTEQRCSMVHKKASILSIFHSGSVQLLMREASTCAAFVSASTLLYVLSGQSPRDRLLAAMTVLSIFRLVS